MGKSPGGRSIHGLMERRAGMQLLITCPYSGAPNARDVDFIGRVVRLEQRSDARTGVAVELLTTVVNKKRVRLFHK